MLGRAVGLKPASGEAGSSRCVDFVVGAAIIRTDHVQVDRARRVIGRGPAPAAVRQRAADRVECRPCVMRDEDCVPPTWLLLLLTRLRWNDARPGASGREGPDVVGV